MFGVVTRFNIRDTRTKQNIGISTILLNYKSSPYNNVHKAYKVRDNKLSLCKWFTYFRLEPLLQ